MTWGFAALAFSTLVEGFTLAVAIRAVAAGARATGMRFLDFVKSGRDPVSVAIMAEDGAAVAGVIVASVCTALVQVRPPPRLSQPTPCRYSAILFYSATLHSLEVVGLFARGCSQGHRIMRTPHPPIPPRPVWPCYTEHAGTPIGRRWCR